jgi:hypothetical protein
MSFHRTNRVLLIIGLALALTGVGCSSSVSGSEDVGAGSQALKGGIPARPDAGADDEDEDQDETADTDDDADETDEAADTDDDADETDEAADTDDDADEATEVEDDDADGDGMAAAHAHGPKT